MDTTLIPDEWEPVGCAGCGERRGWVRSEFAADSRGCLCDECMKRLADAEAETSEEEEEEEESHVSPWSSDLADED